MPCEHDWVEIDEKPVEPDSEAFQFAEPREEIRIALKNAGKKILLRYKKCSLCIDEEPVPYVI